jgi:hypothetical protein
MNPTVGARRERECPWCAELILAKAQVCRFCGRDVAPLDEPTPNVVATAVPQRPAPVIATPGASPSPLTVPAHPATVRQPPANVATISARPSAPDPSTATPDVPSTSVGPTVLGPDAVRPAVTPPSAAESAAPQGVRPRPAPKAPEGKSSWFTFRRQTSDADLRGIGGWLAWFCLGQILTVMSGVAALWSDIGTLMTWDARGMISTASGGKLAIAAYDAMTACFVVLALLLLAFVVRSRPGAPRVAKLALGAGAALCVGQLVVIAYMQLGMSKSDSAYKEVSDLGVNALRGLMYSLIWFLYWKKSRRVEVTFGGNASTIRRLEPPARAELRRMGMLSGAAVAVLVVAAGIEGAKEERSLKAALESPPAVADSTYDPTAVFVASLRAQGVDVDSLVKAHASDKDNGVWMQNLTAAAVTTDLTPSERREVASLRAMTLDRATVEVCASAMTTNSAYDEKLLTAAERKRFSELSGIAVGRRLSGRFPSETDSVSKTRAWTIIRQYATPADLQALAVFDHPQSASTQELCTAVRTFYRVFLDVPSGTRDDRDGIYFLVNLLSGR